MGEEQKVNQRELVYTEGVVIRRSHRMEEETADKYTEGSGRRRRRKRRKKH